MRFYWCGGYRLILNERGIHEQTRWYTKEICRWESIVLVGKIANSNKLIIQTQNTSWTSPRLDLLNSSNLKQTVYIYHRNEQRELDIVKILLKGGNIPDIANKLDIDVKFARQVTQKTAEKLHNIVLKVLEES